MCLDRGGQAKQHAAEKPPELSFAMAPGSVPAAAEATDIAPAILEQAPVGQCRKAETVVIEIPAVSLLGFDLTVGLDRTTHAEECSELVRSMWLALVDGDAECDALANLGAHQDIVAVAGPGVRVVEVGCVRPRDRLAVVCPGQTLLLTEVWVLCHVAGLVTERIPFVPGGVRVGMGLQDSDKALNVETGVIANLGAFFSLL